MKKQLKLFLVAVFLMGMAGGIFNVVFANFLKDVFDMGPDARGWLEVPREFPGLLVALFAGLLFFVPETFIAVLAALAVGAGMLGMAFWGEDIRAMMCFMVVWSAGSHMIMPIRSSIGMSLADPGQKGRRMGQVNGTMLASGIIGCSIVAIVMRLAALNYKLMFTIGGIAALAAAGVFLVMRMPDAHLNRPKYIVKKRYWLFYVLAALFGARKQIFLTFGPWVLIRVFDQPVYIMAQLWIVSAAMGAILQPWLGRLIDRFGERRMLMIDSVCVFAVCIGYALSHLIGRPNLALWLLYLCYIGDQLLFGMNMARATYISKIAIKPEHVAPSLSLGISIDHAVSMVIAAIGGIVWLVYGHTMIFLVAAGIALLMYIFSGFIKIPGQR